MIDLHYREEGLFVTYYPNTEAGIAAWKEMLKQSPSGKFLSTHRKQINAQLKAAGYSVRKTPPVRMTKGEVDYLFGKLGGISA